MKPAFEPIIVARKPLIGTVAANVQRFGTGALNIDASRVFGDKGSAVFGTSNATVSDGRMFNKSPEGSSYRSAPVVGDDDTIGRWPANLIHDGSDEVVALFPQTASGAPIGIKAGGQGNAFGAYAGGIPVTGFGDSGSAARFFYCAKASREDRGEGNGHPTVKPTDLMRYLCRLVTPPGGLILDPFAGSGSTGKAAILEGFNFIGIELSHEYAEIARARIYGAAPLFAEAVT